VVIIGGTALAILGGLGIWGAVGSLRVGSRA
jgi:hypothetical protein